MSVQLTGSIQPSLMDEARSQNNNLLRGAVLGMFAEDDPWQFRRGAGSPKPATNHWLGIETRSAAIPVYPGRTIECLPGSGSGTCCGPVLHVPVLQKDA